MSQSSDQHPSDGRTDFDFYLGTWDVQIRRPKRAIPGEVLTGVSVVRKVMGGLGNLEEIILDYPTGRILGMTLRLFDPTIHQWRLYWADTLSGWNWSQPQIGAFVDGRGDFYSHGPSANGYILTRFVWSDMTATSCHWEQAMSSDGGHIWDTNLLMDFTRRS